MLSGTWLAASALFVVLSVTATGRATQLSWTAPELCPTQQSVEEMLSERVGQDYRAVGDFHFQAEVSRLGDERWRLELRFEQPSAHTGWQERSVEGLTCSSVADAGVVVMALALQHEERGAEPASPAVAAAPSESPTRARDRAPPPRRPAQPVGAAPPSVEVGMGALALVDSGALPEVAFGAELGGQLRVSRLVVRAAAFGFPRVSHDVVRGGAASSSCSEVRSPVVTWFVSCPWPWGAAPGSKPARCLVKGTGRSSQNVKRRSGSGPPWMSEGRRAWRVESR